MTLPNPRLIAGRGGAGTTTRSPAGITDSVPDPDVRSARSWGAAGRRGPAAARQL